MNLARYAVFASFALAALSSAGCHRYYGGRGAYYSRPGYFGRGGYYAQPAYVQPTYQQTTVQATVQAPPPAQVYVAPTPVYAPPPAAPTGIVVQTVPPPPAVAPQEQVVAGAPGQIYIQGQWQFSANGYVWVPGGWVTPPSATSQWVPGTWQVHPQGHVWVQGRWQ